MPVTIDDVARSAGVSTATVSRALRGLPHVNEQTRAAVHRIALDLGYVPSKSASTLASGRTRTVGVVTPHIAKWYFAQAIEALEKELRAVGYDVLLLALPPGPTSVRPVFDPEELRQRVDAVAVLTVPLTGRELDGLRGLRLPMAFVGASVAGAMSVRIDDVAVGRTATEHLLSLGHTRIGHIGGDPEEALNFHAPVDRRTGWMSALRGAGLSPDPCLDVPGMFTVEGGARAMRAMLALERPPTRWRSARCPRRGPPACSCPSCCRWSGSTTTSSPACSGSRPSGSRSRSKDGRPRGCCSRRSPAPRPTATSTECCP